MFTEIAIQKAIEKIKKMQPAEYSSFVMSIAKKQSELSTFINGGHYKVINRTERNCLNYYFEIVYLLFETKHGNMPTISTKKLENEKARCLEYDLFKQSITKEGVLEVYLKRLIHGDNRIRTISTTQIVATICTCINIFNEFSEDEK